VQGHLRNQLISVDIETKCSHCGLPLHITVDSELRTSVREAGAVPLVFTPDVDWDNFAESTIIDSY
jgi:hypothetical protein